MTCKRLFARIVMPLMCVLFTQIAFSQTRTISGTVNDDKGLPVAKATVLGKGTSTATTTNDGGSFTITLPTSVRVLIVSSVGFTTIEVDISNRNSVAITLSAQDQVLTDVVVVGYGTARRKDLTGSVASLREKDFNKGVITAPDQLLQGKIAGVQIINNTGAPGGATTVRIRGISSLRSGNQPLFVVDGVPLSGGSASPGLGTALGNAPGDNPLNFINPADIVAIDVLKDASATAIYGSRGANGVVLITTKKGASGAPRVELTSSVGVSTLLRRIKVLSGDQYRKALSDYGITSGGNFGKSIDGIDEVTRAGITTNNNVAVSGGNENGKYRISIGYLNQQGIVGADDLKINLTPGNPATLQNVGDRHSGFKKYTASLASSFKFLESKRLGLDINVLTAHTTTDVAPISNDAGFQGSLIGNALQFNPTHALKNTDGTVWIIDPALGNTTVNPLALLAAYNDVNNLTTVLGSISPSFKITNDLEYRYLFSVNYSTGIRKSEMRNWLNVTGIEGKGFAQIAQNRSINQQSTHTLTYTKAINQSLNLNALIGYEYLKFDFSGNGQIATKFVDYPGLDYTSYMQNSPQSNRSINSFSDPIAELQSFFARATFNIRDKYLLTGTIRADGSSKFGANNRYGYFPSFAGAWNISNEDFMKDNSFINNLKLRLGWGRTGNQEFPTAASKRVVGITLDSGQVAVRYPNKDVKWETNTLTNAGIDFTVFKSRLSGSIDVYTRKTTDALFERDVTAPGPASGKYWINLPGEIQNKGVEIALNAGLVRNRTLNWNLGVNAAFQKNELKDFVGAYETGGLHGQGISGATSQRLVSDQPINVFYLRKFQGIDKTSGQSIYADNGNTLYYVGSPSPKFLLGISTDVTYKKWILVVNANGAFGHKVYNNTLNSVLPIGNLGTRNISENLIGHAIQENLSNPLAPSTRYLEDGGYVKLANATISYRLGDVAKIFKGAVISLTGQNLYVISSFKGFDPEVNVDKSVNGIPSLGIEYIPYPTARTFILGVNFSL